MQTECFVKETSCEKAERNRSGGAFSVLQLQCVAAVVCVAAVMLLRCFAPPLYRMLRDEFNAVFALREEEEPVRFAQAFIDDLFVQAQAAALPERCSLEPYIPEQQVVLPLEEYTLSSPYGWRTHPISGDKSFHNGVDLAANEGSVIRCAMEGMVQFTGCDALNGNYLIGLHPDGVVTSYCHMQYVFARAGEFVAAGHPIGTVGQTGSATGPHLHFVLKHNGIRYNPSEMLGI